MTWLWWALGQRHLPALVAGALLCPSRFSPIHELLFITVGADLPSGVVSLLVHVGDGEIIWGLGGLDIGVVDLLM